MKPVIDSSLYFWFFLKFLFYFVDSGGDFQDRLQIDHADEAVRGTLILENGELMWPAPQLKSAQAAQPPPKKETIKPEIIIEKPVSERNRKEEKRKK